MNHAGAQGHGRSLKVKNSTLLRETLTVDCLMRLPHATEALL